jgi:hypothetical protein
MSTKKAELWFYAHCDKTTEMGEDELYLQMSVDGGSPQRIPPTGHWNVNDNGPKRKVTQKVFQRDLESGEEVKIVLVVMEEDAGVPPEFIDGLSRAGQQYASQEGSKAGPIIPLLGELLKLLTKNTDDVIGSFAISISNVGGNVVLKVDGAHKEVNEERLAHDQDDGRPLPNFRARGDGTNYHIVFWEGGPRQREPEAGELGR